jgi:F-type H+-transporting ATPase subunit delta
MSVETVARRYATALADIVLSAGNAAEVKAELDGWQNMIRSNKDLSNAFGNPTIAHAKKEKVLTSLLERTSPHKTTANFLKVLLQNSRLMNLAAINKKLAQVLEERSGTVSGTVTTARELSESERTDFVSSLRKRTGKNVNLSFEVDDSVIGGSVTRVGSTLYDDSIKTQLQTLKEQMIRS